MTTYRVISALVLANDGTQVHYIYEGGTVPSGVKPETIDSWLKSGYIERTDGPPAEAAPVERPTAEQLVAQFAASGLTVTTDEAQAILDRQPETADDGEETPKGPLPALPQGAPGRTAKKDKWEAYLVMLGMDEEAAKAATKDELIDRAVALASQD